MDQNAAIGIGKRTSLTNDGTNVAGLYNEN